MQVSIFEESKLIRGHKMDYSPKFFYEKNGLIYLKAGWLIVPVDISKR